MTLTGRVHSANFAIGLMTCDRTNQQDRQEPSRLTHNHPRCDLIQRLGEPILVFHQILRDLHQQDFHQSPIRHLTSNGLTSSVTRSPNIR